MQEFSVVVGYDPREDLAYRVCVSSLIRRSSVPIRVVPLVESWCQTNYNFNRPYLTESGIYRRDSRDGRPYSTAFAFTRFLIPFLNIRGPILFMDCDMLVLEDIAELFEQFDTTKAIQCVKHDFQSESAIKMDSIPQIDYHRKLWSSVVLWNTDHEANRRLTIEDVNNRSGRDLHKLFWLSDEEIGALDPRWNWIPKQTNPTPYIVHFTEKTPWFSPNEVIPFADLWQAERALVLK